MSSQKIRKSLLKSRSNAINAKCVLGKQNSDKLGKGFAMD